MKTYLIWKLVGGGGGTKSLNKKNWPWVVYKFSEPPWVSFWVYFKCFAAGNILLTTKSCFDITYYTRSIFYSVYPVVIRNFLFGT